jgi:hypothetical protein
MCSAKWHVRFTPESTAESGHQVWQLSLAVIAERIR